MDRDRSCVAAQQLADPSAVACSLRRGWSSDTLREQADADPAATATMQMEERRDYRLLLRPADRLRLSHADARAVVVDPNDERACVGGKLAMGVWWPVRRCSRTDSSTDASRCSPRA